MLNAMVKENSEQRRGSRSPGEKVFRKEFTEELIFEQRLEEGDRAKQLSRGKAFQ